MCVWVCANYDIDRAQTKCHVLIMYHRNLSRLEISDIRLTYITKYVSRMLFLWYRRRLLVSLLLFVYVDVVVGRFTMFARIVFDSLKWHFYRIKSVKRFKTPIWLNRLWNSSVSSTHSIFVESTLIERLVWKQKKVVINRNTSHWLLLFLHVVSHITHRYSFFEKLY